MGFHHILGKKSIPSTHRSIALGVIVRGMGNWLPGNNRKNSEINVSLISNVSRAYGFLPRSGWRSWIHKLGIF